MPNVHSSVAGEASPNSVNAHFKSPVRKLVKYAGTGVSFSNHWTSSRHRYETKSPIILPAFPAMYVVARPRMTECEKLSGCLPFRHDQSLCTYTLHPILHSAGLVVSSGRTEHRNPEGHTYGYNPTTKGGVWEKPEGQSPGCVVYLATAIFDPTLRFV